MTIQDITANPTTDQMDGVQDTIARRINPFGVTEPVIQLMDNNRVLVPVARDSRRGGGEEADRADGALGVQGAQLPANHSLDAAQWRSDVPL